MGHWGRMGAMALAFCLCGTSAQANGLGIAGDYNVFVFEDYTASNSDVEGALAAGGDVRLQNYLVGNQLPANSGDVLVAGGQMEFTNGEVHHGNIVTGGSATLNSVTVPDGVVMTEADTPIDFAAQRSSLTGLSTSLALLSSTGTTSSPWGGALLFQGDGSSNQQVFHVNGDALSNANTFRFVDDTMVPDESTLLFNISGTSVEMSNFDMMDFRNGLGDSWDNVLFNFYQAEELNLSSIGIFGSILAPYADIETGYGQLNGTVVANSWDGPMQVNYHPFDGDIMTPVPEPNTLLLFGSGLLGLASVIRKKRS